MGIAGNSPLSRSSQFGSLSMMEVGWDVEVGADVGVNVFVVVEDDGDDGDDGDDSEHPQYSIPISWNKFVQAVLDSN